MSRPTSTTFAPHRARLVRALDQISGALAARLLDQVLVGQREHGNRLRVLAAELQDTRRSIHHRFDHLETVMTDVRSEFNQNLTDLGAAIGELSTRIAALPDDANDITQADLDSIKALTGQVNTLAVAAPEVPTEETPAPVEDEPATPTEDAPVEQSGDARL